MSFHYSELPESVLLGNVPATTDALTTLLGPVFLIYAIPFITHFAVIKRRNMPEGRLFTQGFYPRTSLLLNKISGRDTFVQALIKARAMIRRPNNYQISGTVLGWDLRATTLPGGIGFIAMGIWLKG